MGSKHHALDTGNSLELLTLPTPEHIIRYKPILQRIISLKIIRFGKIIQRAQNGCASARRSADPLALIQRIVGLSGIARALAGIFPTYLPGPLKQDKRYGY
ncbi:hypothetical protein R75465_05668 [Paraburkholderia aspalathi]|nr:hypothetical protein R75465_05668 [Paraburkholderia aspalathi]